MGILLQRNRKRHTSDVEEVEEVVSDIQQKEVTTSDVEETDEKPKRKP
ncbi:hypothetical protein [Pseudolactococcus piscium]|uniref:Uncharacterized protein n=1 Tax=Pseudolactococcus piscium MKFS47 TaxID=297352 RepID=A0A0D6DZH0_9LACT|nr:hypothetical protein [Lactococcus piscium]CEN29143.1 Uncharacterized protein LACPI_1943 [Lactococcus piscium MKFS47]